MEPITILIAVAGIVATGALSKVGENVTDEAISKSKWLLSKIREKSPKTAIAIERADQQPLDYSQAYFEILPASQSDEDLGRLLENMKSLVLADPRLSQMVEEELNKSPQLTTVIEDWKGINIKGGINTITGNTFQF
jgi:hypothetical protein